MLAMGLDLESENLDHQKVAMGMDLAMGLVPFAPPGEVYYCRAGSTGSNARYETSETTGSTSMSIIPPHPNLYNSPGPWPFK